MTQKEINNILEELNNGKFHIECPSCYEEVNLKDAGLFYLDQFSKEAKLVYKMMLEGQKERRAALKQRMILSCKSNGFLINGLNVSIFHIENESF